MCSEDSSILLLDSNIDRIDKAIEIQLVSKRKGERSRYYLNSKFPIRRVGNGRRSSSHYSWRLRNT